MPMQVTVANPNAINLLANDMQSLARDLAGQTRMRSAWIRVRDEVMIPSIQQNFNMEGRPRRWEPVSPVTEMRSPGRVSILHDSGQLEKAATSKIRFNIKNNEMTYGNWSSRRWWGPVHDFGSADGMIPQRQFVVIQQPEDSEHIGEIIMEWVEDMVNKNIKLHYV